MAGRYLSMLLTIGIMVPTLSSQKAWSIQDVLPAVQMPTEQWPAVHRLKVLEAPDWNDYNIYPPAARRLEQEGRVRFEVLVNREGVPRACRIVLSSGHTELDQGTCALALQMRFSRPIEEAGVAEATVSQSIVWTLTDELPLAPSYLAAILTIDTGRITSCKLDGDGALLAHWSRTACDVFASETGFYFGSDIHGSRNARIEVDLTPAGTSLPARSSWGSLIAERRTVFEVNRSGDPSKCRDDLNRGFGTPRVDHAGPCGFFLTGAWFATDPSDQEPPKGSFGVRVYVDKAGQARWP